MNKKYFTAAFIILMIVSIIFVGENYYRENIKPKLIENDEKQTDSVNTAKNDKTDKETLSQDGVSYGFYRGIVSQEQIKSVGDTYVYETMVKKNKYEITVEDISKGKTLTDDIKSNTINIESHINATRAMVSKKGIEIDLDLTIKSDEYSYVFARIKVKNIGEVKDQFTPLTFGLARIDDNIVNSDTHEARSVCVSDVNGAGRIDFMVTIKQFQKDETVEFIITYIIPELYSDTDMGIVYEDGLTESRLIDNESVKYVKFNMKDIKEIN